MNDQSVLFETVATTMILNFDSKSGSVCGVADQCKVEELATDSLSVSEVIFSGVYLSEW